MKGQKRHNKKGFTLLEILLALSILGILTVFGISIANSARNFTNVSKTRNSMEQIVAKAQEYYRSHEQLPAPPTGTNQVPVGAGALNLIQKYRLDAWGRYFYYNSAENAAIDFHKGFVSLAAGSMTEILALQVNGKRVAGVLISGGPNQIFDYTTSGSDPVIYALDAESDDIIIPIDVSQEAVAIALNELSVLDSKAKAFDARFEGIDNNADTGVDEDECVEIGEGCTSHPCIPTSWNNCPPQGSIGTVATDPNCGTATLDAIKAATYSFLFCDAGNCSPTWDWTSVSNSLPTDDPVNAFMFCLYSLPNTLIFDPWLNVYVWGDAATYASSNPRYHKFFSLGPNGCSDGLTVAGNLCASGTNADDIMP